MSDEGMGSGQETTQDINDRQMSDIEIVDSDSGEPLSFGSDLDLEPKAEPAPKAQPTNGAQPKTLPQQSQPTPTIPDGFDRDFYGQDGQFDASKVFETVGKIKPVEFRSPVMFEPEPAPAATAPGAQNLQQEGSKAIGEEVKAYEMELRASILKPLESAYARLAQQGRLTQGSELDVALREEYQMALDQIREKTNAKRDELYEKRLASRDEQFATKQKRAEVESKSQATIYRVAMDNGGMEKFNRLMFGTTAPDPKDPTKQTVIKGPGADILELAFKVANPGKQFKPGEYQKALSDWWTDVSADEDNVRMFHELAYGRWVLKNWQKINDAQRAAIEREVANRGRRSSPLPSNRNSAPTARGVDPIEAFLNPSMRDSV